MRSLLIIALFAAATSLCAVTADNVLVVINDSNKDSEAVGMHYAKMRNVPAGNICRVKCNENTLTLEEYNSQLLPEVKKHLNGIAFVVMSFGTPVNLSINGVGYSLDAFLCFPNDAIGNLQPFGEDGKKKGGFRGEPNPYYQAGGKFGSNGRNVMVTRIDGPTADIAYELVERALYGEKYITKKYGKAYIDTRGLTPDSKGYYGPDQDMLNSAEFLKAAGFETMVDTSEMEYDNKCCPDALFYFGWYKYNNYNDAFYWKVGAVGIHLDSAAAIGIRGTKCWSGGALAKGITATGGAVNEPYAETYTRANLFFKYLMSGYNFAEACYMSTPISKWMMTFIGDPLYTPSKSEGLTDTSRPSITKLDFSKSDDNPDTYWKTFVDADKFVMLKVEYAPAGGENIAMETDSFFKKSKVNLKDLVPNTEYKVLATVTDSSGNTDVKAGSFKTTPPVPEAIKGLSAENKSGEVSLSWQKSSAEDVTGYRLFKYSMGSPEVQTQIGEFKKEETSFTDKGLVNGSTYCYTARAVNLNGDMSPRTEVYAVPTDLAAVSGLKAEFKINALKLTWNAVKSDNVTGYDIYRHVKKKGNFKKIKSTKETSMMDFETKKGQVYYYKVVTLGKGGVEGETTELLEVKMEN